MTTNFFIEQINRLTSVFGQSNFSPERVKIIKNHVEEMPQDEFRKTVNFMIETMKTAPLPSDFRNAAYAWKRSSKVFEDVVSVQSISCVDCYETGYIFCQLNGNEPITLVFCHCDHGIKSKEYDRIEFVPRWEKKVFENSYGFIKHDFPFKKFVPDQPESAEQDVFVANAKQLSWWKSEKQKAFNYWDQKTKQN